ncbi:MAG: MBL fold metallo-hydrolase [Pelagibacteraceae bacterium]
MTNKTKIEFVNHASVLITSDNLGILSDPWYFFSTFNKGWRLLYENKIDYVESVLSRSTHIYISHEHPDHFNPRFLLEKKIKELIIKNNITFIFQKTKDKRVVSFLKKNNFLVQECDLDKIIKLNDKVSVKISKHDFYDSSIAIFTQNHKILNLNDCPLKGEREIKDFKKKHGEFDILLTQFSYAAWKGGIDNTELRQIAAKEKIDAMISQAKILNCKFVIPFASYIYFSNKMNFYMNDSVNKPETVVKELANEKINSIIMAPEETQNLDSIKQNPHSLEFWKQKFDLNNKNKEIDEYKKSVNLEELNLNFEDYRKKIFKKNSKIIITLLHKLPIFNIFQDIVIYLEDHKKSYSFSILKGLHEKSNSEYDISMHSDSLLFIFKNEFGFDTLTVNGCFQTKSKKFSKVTKTLALGSLNAMGLGLNYKLIFDMQIILLFLKKVSSFFKKLKSTEQPT